MIKSLINKLLCKKINFEKENEYYQKFFIDNPDWNSFEPNIDEQSRLEKIEKFCNQIGVNDYQEKFRIIDIGCGRGWLSEKLTAYGEVTGIEPVESVVNFAKKLYSKPTFLAFTVPEFLNKFKLTLGYDLAVCSEVLEHVSDKKTFIRDINRLLKINGYFIITTPRGELREMWEAKYDAPSQPVEKWISTTDLIKLLDNNGFVVIDSTTAYSEDIYQIHLAIKKIDC